jgi:hypothetical protein
MKRSHHRWVLASAIVCGLALVALLVSHRLDPRRHGITVTSRFHVGFFDGGVWFYSDQWPYRGSIIQVDGQPPLLRQAGFDFSGIYYRIFRFPADSTWSLVVSLWYPIVLSAILPALWIYRRRRIHLSHDDAA